MMLYIALIPNYRGGMKGGSILKVKGFFYHSHHSRLGFWTFFTILRSKGWF